MSVGQTNELARLRSQTIWQMLSRVTQRNPQRNALVAANDAGEVQHLCYGRLCERIYSSEEWDPVFAAGQELGIVFALHTGADRRRQCRTAVPRPAPRISPRSLRISAGKPL